MRQRNPLLKIWLGIAALIVIVLVAAAISSAATSSSYHDKVAAADARAHFWRTIGGEETRSDETVDGQLANDIRNWFKDPTVLHRPGTFRGDSNAYGGITSALHGYDPFDESCGPECGHLSPDAEDKAISALSGQAEQVIASEKPKPEHGLGMTMPATALGIWVLIGGALFLWPVVRQRGIMAGTRSSYPAEARMLNKLDDSIRELPEGDPSYDSLITLRSGLQKAMTRRMRAGEDEIQVMRRKRLMDEAEAMLESMNEGNQALN